MGAPESPGEPRAGPEAWGCPGAPSPLFPENVRTDPGRREEVVGAGPPP